jgi:hypothetical protein
MGPATVAMAALGIAVARLAGGRDGNRQLGAEPALVGRAAADHQLSASTAHRLALTAGQSIISTFSNSPRRRNQSLIHNV